VTLWFLAGVLTALIVTLLVVNLSSGEKKLDQQLERKYGCRDAQFRYEMGTLLGPPILEGNRHLTLVNGVQIFPAMLDGIAQARHNITFESYIYWSGEVGQRFADALGERSRAGVRVHVLVDWAGSVKMDDRLADEMRAAGVQVQRFHKPRWYHLGRINNRTHRKILVIDGRIGFTGGVGIAPQWEGDAEDPEHWRDTHFQVEGPVVAQLQSVFIDNWTKASGKVLHGVDYFPQLEPVGDERAHVFSSSPSGGAESMQLMYMMAITAAERSIDLQSAYFVPNRLTRIALVEALKRGVKLRIIVPGKYTDSDIVRRASRAEWGGMLEAGAEISEFQPTMYHCKALVVDSCMSSVGSTNFDERSFHLNDEANPNVYDEGFAREQTRLFEADLERSRRITFAEWQARPLHERIKEKLAALVRSQL